MSYFSDHWPLCIICGTRKAILRVLIEQLHNVMSHFGADEINLYIKVKHNIKDPLEVRWPCREKIKKSLWILSLMVLSVMALKKFSLFHYYHHHYYVSVAFVLLWIEKINNIYPNLHALTPSLPHSSNQFAE